VRFELSAIVIARVTKTEITSLAQSVQLDLLMRDMTCQAIVHGPRKRRRTEVNWISTKREAVSKDEPSNAQCAEDPRYIRTGFNGLSERVYVFPGAHITGKYARLSIAMSSPQA